MKTDLLAIKQAIAEKFGSLDEPSFTFIKEALKADPFRPLIETLSSFVEVTDETDVNNDHGQTVVLSQQSKKWCLQLSYVGPYAALMRLSGGPKLLSREAANLDASEQAISAAVSKAGLALLPKSTLETPIRLRLFAADPENTCIYQALFSDTDVLPWKA